MLCGNRNNEMLLEVYGECVDLPFPNIEPSYDETEIERLAKEYFDKIQK